MERDDEPQDLSTAAGLTEVPVFPYSDADKVRELEEEGRRLDARVGAYLLQQRRGLGPVRRKN